MQQLSFSSGSMLMLCPGTSAWGDVWHCQVLLVKGEALRHMKSWPGPGSTGMPCRGK